MKSRIIECIAAAVIPFAVAILPTSTLATVNTVGQLNCSAGEVAVFDGANWVCSNELNDFSAEIQSLEQALADEVAAREAADAALQILINGLARKSHQSYRNRPLFGA